MQRAGEDQRRPLLGGEQLGDESRAGEVRLLGVLGLGKRQRPAGLGGEQVHPGGPEDSSRARSSRFADVRGLDPGAAALQLLELTTLGRLPVVGERDLVALGQGHFGERGTDVPRPEHQEAGQG